MHSSAAGHAVSHQRGTKKRLPAGTPECSPRPASCIISPFHGATQPFLHTSKRTWYEHIGRHSLSPLTYLLNRPGGKTGCWLEMSRWMAAMSSPTHLQSCSDRADRGACRPHCAGLQYLMAMMTAHKQFKEKRTSPWFVP